jgi:3-phenylpropionate/trans-cinnamate dioxygenase ferredoxin component
VPAWTRLIGTNELAEGAAKVVSLADTEVAVFKIGGKFYAIENECLHRGGPLGEGQLKGHTIVCPWHGWKYDVATGALELMPTLKVRTFDVEVRGDDVLVDLSQADG